MAGQETIMLGESMTNNDLDTCYRLFAEYYLDNNLYIDIDNGQMYVEIGKYEAGISFNFQDIHVSSN